MDGMDGEGMDGEGMDGTDAAPSFPTCCFLRSPQFLSCRKAAKREILLCDFEGCGKIFSNRQYLNVRAAVGRGLWGQDPLFHAHHCIHPSPSVCCGLQSWIQTWSAALLLWGSAMHQAVLGSAVGHLQPQLGVEGSKAGGMLRWRSQQGFL